MLKFRDLSEENAERISDELFSSDDFAKEVLYSFDYSDLDVSYGVAECCGCILVRIFDYGRYLFLFPIEFTEDADVATALLEISEYAMREEIGFTLTDVPASGVSLLLECGFLHLDVDSEGEGSFRVKVKTECELISDIPEFDMEELHASALLEEDKEPYAEICRDEELNRFWGYDYKEDTADASDDFFFDGARDAFSSGTSMITALHFDGKLVGFTELFAFDGRGAAECAVKIAKEYHGRGFGSLAARSAIETAKRLGLTKLFCDIMKENAPSLKLFGKYFDECESVYPDRKRFVKIL